MSKDRKFDWDSITISKYYDIKDILDDEETDDITKNVKMVSIILDMPEDEIWDMDLTTVGQYIDKLKFLNKFDIPKSPNMNITLPGYKLQVMKDVTKITIAQYVDYQSFISLPFRESIDKILSVFLIPEDHKYNDGYDILDLQKTIRENLSFRVAEGLLGFFLRKYGESLIHSLRLLRREARRMKKNPEMKKEILEKEKEIKKMFQDLIHLTGYVSSIESPTGPR